LLAGCAQLGPLPGDPFAFGVLGDTPYSESDVVKLDRLIERINAQDLAFVVHVGDLGTSAASQACSGGWLEARQRQFAKLHPPFILLPGDNEWTDCAKHGMDPQIRLAAWRRLFCHHARGLALERQPGQCENVRWQANGMAFIGLNVPGGGSPDLGDARMAATLEWLDESLALAEQRPARRVFVFLHADPRFERVGGDDAYARLRAVLATHAAWLKDSLVLVHGDTHVYRDDEPVPGLRRLEPWGAPFVSWLRAKFAGDALRVQAGW
jgi:predicted phosphodiesterase